MQLVERGGDYVPDECAYAYLLVALVEFADGQEQFVDHLVWNDGKDSVVHLGPGVGAAVRVADVVAAPLHVLPEGEAAYAERVEHILDAFGAGLVEDYKD